ncbi:hypothetical protein K0M31_004388 [Melipona bicolor]|uniref:Uncharacterized protein n=1 Tax=Melipona bicolor TaxID=60889 RepID=A0AA40FXE1_9HYME|nr:hypothetical protein K0M31_004388 [Melipona bicolor]
MHGKNGMAPMGRDTPRSSNQDDGSWLGSPGLATRRRTHLNAVIRIQAASGQGTGGVRDRSL